MIPFAAAAAAREIAGTMIRGRGTARQLTGPPDPNISCICSFGAREEKGQCDDALNVATHRQTADCRPLV